MVSVNSLIVMLLDFSDELVFFVYRDDNGAWHLTDFAPVAAFSGDVWFGYLDLVFQLDRYRSGFTDVLSDGDIDQIKRLFGVK